MLVGQYNCDSTGRNLKGSFIHKFRNTHFAIISRTGTNLPGNKVLSKLSLFPVAEIQNAIFCAQKRTRQPNF
ncbi:hypothetical protein, partial [Vibrio anguillarum]|uniref:hypothetical protein n=1 Tax=Vibrio anguillarum TaxID=55601 RepID=UPI001BE44801